MNTIQPILLVGDNPFHGISHLSQQNVRKRSPEINSTKYASDLINISVKNGANGFMFSVSDTTLSILRQLPQKSFEERLDLYALVPYAYEYVRIATHAGGLPGLAERFANQVLRSGSVKTAAIGLKGVFFSDPMAVMNAYLSYELLRIKIASKKRGVLRSVLLHEVITDMVIALNLENLAKEYIKFMTSRDIKPGFETRNFSFLVNKFKEWKIDFKDVVIAAPFNKLGFYMNPSKIECEKALIDAYGSTVIMMSILAAGYLKPSDAIEYVRNTNANAVVVGVSNERQARETFSLLRA
jgi:hypothetical protein